MWCRHFTCVLFWTYSNSIPDIVHNILIYNQFLGNTETLQVSFLPASNVTGLCQGKRTSWEKHVLKKVEVTVSTHRWHWMQCFCRGRPFYGLQMEPQPLEVDLANIFWFFSVTVQLLVVLLILEVSGSILCPEAGYSCDFSWNSSVPPSKLWFFLKVGHTSFLPHPF
jgi:hypothetical protein